MLLCSAVSVDLNIPGAPRDLLTKFVDCLVLLPNLEALEVFRANPEGPPQKELGWERARFPSVRELVVEDTTATLVGCCPNVESVVFTDGFYSENPATLGLHEKGLEKLKRFVGVGMPGVELGEPRHRCWSEAYIR